MERIERLIRELSERRWRDSRELTDWTVQSGIYRSPGVYTDLEDRAGGPSLLHFTGVAGTTYFLRTEVNIPGSWGEEGGLLFDSGGEGLLRVNGQSRQGLDRNHTYAFLPGSAGRRLALEIELFDPIPEPEDPLNRQAVIRPPIQGIVARLVLPDRAVQSLLHTVIVLSAALRRLPDGGLPRFRLQAALYRTMDEFRELPESSPPDDKVVCRLERRLREEVASLGGNAPGFIHMVGQSHLDIAWLWPARETIRKVSRTFSTVDALMEEYPGFRYAQSQPQLFAYLKEHDPTLYDRVKRRIVEGRWELVGGMWVEPDLNLPSGESLMRQMLYGQTFYRREFGIVSPIEWLPDTFGYCASLPQILKHGGIRYFMTTKLNWNDTNPFPHDLFHWVGIDGTAMIAYLNHGLNENTLPGDVAEHWASYRQKTVCGEQMLLYGHGDGGGGVTREMLESIERADLMIGQPFSDFGTAEVFFSGVEKAAAKLPRWHGDLYLELHRGTYTTHAYNKLSNRRAEALYREAEIWQALAVARCGLAPEPEAGAALEQLRKGWRLILLNQFHDIIPGSAIAEVYAASRAEYEEIFRIGAGVRDRELARLASTLSAADPQADSQAFAVFNSLGWKRDAVIALKGEQLPVGLFRQTEEASAPDGPLSAVQAFVLTLDDGQSLAVQAEIGREGEPFRLLVCVPNIPAFGSRSFRLAVRPGTGHPATFAASTAPLSDVWETAFYRVRFNGRGEIVSLFDKSADREIVMPGGRANRFFFYHDRPTLWDAWDLDSRYEEQPAGEAELIDRQVLSKGPVQDRLRFRWRIGQSDIIQDMIFYHHDRRIDFSTRVVWREAHKLLKVGFAIRVVTNKATYEIPFGALERPTHRNTSWEEARYEVCGHRFVDVSERGYGVSLLNDGKYGYDVQGSVIRLSLLRAPTWPDGCADQGEHEFVYSLYPHEGGWAEAHTLRKAAELNQPVPVLPVQGNGTQPSAALSPPGASTGLYRDEPHSWIGFSGEHVVLETVKAAEDGSGTVLRFYESSGGSETIELEWPYPFAKAVLSNALEDDLEPLPTNEGRLQLAFAPFEIKTVKFIP